MRQKLILPIFILSLLLVSCTAATLESQSDMEIINLQVSPALEQWLPKASACAEPITDFGVYVEVRPPEELNLDEADLIIRMGKPLEDDPYVTVLGSETISIVAGSEVPLSSISIKTLKAIYTGQIKNWANVSEIKVAGIEINQPIQVLSFPEGNEIRKLFSKNILETSEPSHHLQTFSSLEFFQILLDEYPFSISYLLESQAPEGVKTLSLTDGDSQITQYVLAVTHKEPEGGLRQLLLCLQNSN
ncbi:MAG: substrate-binding domain-containing protein [Chloroflexota bacterium]|nr:substrate-binding domain-containing protein [Chloroflexota bacterium]